MKMFWIAAIALGMATPTLAQDYEHCSITPVDQVGFIDSFTAIDDCVAACKSTEGCDSWSFRPHSFDKSMPGQCKLIKGVFKKEETDKSFCGQL